MDTCFASSQTIDLRVPSQPVPIHHYLRQAQRLVYTLATPDRVTPLDDEHYQFQVAPLSFMNLKFQPVVDLRVTATEQGHVTISSSRCELQGLELFRDRFKFSLEGELYPVMVQGATYLNGQADLMVGVDLPMPFKLMPKSLIEATGTALLNSILLTVKQRLMTQLLEDYQRWVNQQQAELAVLPRG
ncbi:DUF1997 domain-containing protein [Alkalinema sp. FACHB-956]|uniref:DUF1997 domain-containing protein n=1 Tax=Alkalinema sp. FACHB-956 TaxID=2692768 RepID=UPI001682BA45|nr:DUF1997 domain-containing protein [Alkalinema sp. FACHB-956]MBD2328988.1 DUF1997 domain-containing protein [Alkalinema sp. FACHB-956]